MKQISCLLLSLKCLVNHFVFCRFPDFKRAKKHFFFVFVFEGTEVNMIGNGRIESKSDCMLHHADNKIVFLPFNSIKIQPRISSVLEE